MSHGGVSHSGLIVAFRRMRDPLLFLGLPIAFVALSIGSGDAEIGFDFLGTLWEPAKALVEGGPIYPEPTRAAIEIGNPSVYPPPFILLAVPLTLIPAHAAAWLWITLLALAVLGALWVLGVRDWRCYVLAATSPVVMQGLTWGNLTLLLVLPVALAWRYRDKAVVGGLAVGTGIAAKLFLWPLVFWLLFTRRFRAAVVSVVFASVLVLSSWAVVGFQGFADYPDLLQAVQDVYATRSYSVATVAGGLGAPTGVAVAVCAAIGLILLAIAAWLARRVDGDRRAFALVVAACVLASPIVWANYAALLFVPIAVTWPRFSLAWLFSYPIWLAGLLPKPVMPVPEPCCRPADVPETVWGLSHAEPVPWFAAGVVSVVAVVAFGLMLVARERDSTGSGVGRAGPSDRARPLHATRRELRAAEGVDR
jgi:hypothetical protein